MYFVRTECGDTNTVNSNIFTNSCLIWEMQGQFIWPPTHLICLPQGKKHQVISALGKLWCILICYLHYRLLLSAVSAPKNVGGPWNFTPQASRKCWSIQEGYKIGKVKLDEGVDLFCKFDMKVEGLDRTAAFDRIWLIWILDGQKWALSKKSAFV